MLYEVITGGVTDELAGDHAAAIDHFMCNRLGIDDDCRHCRKRNPVRRQVIEHTDFVEHVVQDVQVIGQLVRELVAAALEQFRYRISYNFV